jgi:hypothetical protein
MKKRKHPSDSNSYKKERHQKAKAMWQQNKALIQQNMNTEPNTFSDFYKKISEAVSIRPYPSQAIGRKRNMFLKALALDDNKFREWVQNRLYRLAYDNKRSITDFTPRDIASGLQKWEGLLRNSDPGFGKYDQQFKAYTDRFLKTATALIGNPAAGQGTRNVEPSEAPSLTPAGEPVSPTMINYQTGGGSSVPSQNTQSPAPQGEEQQQEIMPEEEQFLQKMQELEQILSLGDDEFVEHVENSLMERGVDALTANPVDIEEALDEEFQDLIDSVPEGSQFTQDEQMIEEMFAQYKERFLSLLESIKGNTILKTAKANKVAAARAEKLKKDPSLFEIGIVVSAASAVGFDYQESGITDMELKKLQKDSITYSAARRITSSLFQNYPQLSKATPRWMGRETNPSELRQDWEGTDGTSNSDIIFSFNTRKVKFKNNKFISCNSDTRDESCMTAAKMIVKINDMSIAPKNQKDMKAVFVSVIEYLRTKDYDFSNQSSLYQRLLADGVEPEQARVISQSIVENIQMFKSDFENLMQSSEVRSDMKMFLKELSVKLQEIIQMLPGFKQEYIYSSLSGFGKFTEGSPREANFILSSDENGDKMVLTYLDRNLAAQLTSVVQMNMNVLPPKVGRKDPLMQKYIKMGMTKEEAQLKIAEDHPFRLNDLLDRVEQTNQMNMMMDPNMAGTILPENSILYSFMKNIKTLKEQEEPIVQNDPETQEYINAAVNYAFDTFTNMIRFFGIEFGEVSTTEINLYNMLYSEQPQNMTADLNNRVDMNNQLGDEMEQNRMENGVQNKWFEYKQKGRPSV